MIEFTIKYIRSDPAFYHPECPVLYTEHDTIGVIEDCPFPLETDSFKVLLYGTSVTFKDDDPKYGNNKKFAVVEYTKSCGHKVQERISFIENVEDFTHCGTKYTGASYSINDWERRIEFFRTIAPCDVCDMVRHSLWCQKFPDTRKSEKRRRADLEKMLDSNYANWRDMVTLDGKSLHKV